MIYPPSQKPPIWSIDPGVIAYNCQKAGMPLPIGAWPFWEGGGNLARDYSGHGNHGTLSPQSLWKGNGIYISPDDEYITVSDLSAIGGSQDRTICVVGKTTKTSNIPYLFSCGSAVTGQKYAMRLDDLNSYALRVEIHGGYVSGGVVGNDGERHTFISVLNGTLLSDVTLYVDGLLQGITASANTSTAINTVLGGYANNIGNENNSVHASWGDNIESVIIFDTAISTSQAKFLSDNPYFMYQIPEELYGYVAAAPPTGNPFWYYNMLRRRN